MGENSGSSGVKSEYHDLIAHNAALLAQVAALSSKVSEMGPLKLILLTPTRLQI